MRANKCSLKTSTLTCGIYCQRLTLSFLLFTLSFYLLSFAEVNATIRYVSKTGSSTPPYTSWETAADSIQKCINICVFGDTIYVANGVYQEQVVMIPGLSLIGAGSDSTIINTQTLVNAQDFVAVAVQDSCVIRGFHVIVYYNNDKGRGIKIDGNSIAEFNKVSGSARGFWMDETGNKRMVVYKNYIYNVQRGVHIYNSSPLVRGNSIFPTDNNAATILCGIWIDAINTTYRPIIDSNYIEANYRTDGINKNPGTRSTITNNEIIMKGGTDGIFLHSFASDSNWVLNNKIYAEEGIDAIYTTGSNYLYIYNNYATGNFLDLEYAISVGPNHTVINNVVTNAERGVEAWGTQNLIFKYNNVWNNDINYDGFVPDTTNLSVDPMIVNDDTTQGKLDFHLQKYSPLIDAGDPNILDKDSTRSDIGLYGGPYGESYIYVDLPPRTPVNLTAEVDSNIVTLNWNNNEEADFSSYNLFYDTTKNFQIDSTKLVSSQPDTFYYFVIPPEAESLYFKLTAVDNQGNESNPSEEVGVLITSVDDEWKPLNNYILYQNYPNPFNPSTRISYKLKEQGYVKLYVYDIKGELVSILVNEVQEAGYYEVEFDAQIGSRQEAVGKSLASGVYIYQIFVQGENNIPVFSDIKKMVYVK